MRMKLRLVKDWPDWWRWHSTKALVLLGLLPTIWLEMPPDLKSMIPSHWLQVASFVVMLLGMLSRITRQKAPPGSVASTETENSNNSSQH
ncbi:hypothetical protein J2X14_001156 [Pantoea alhagi]|uniref:DUF7940 domain-containing protein n=1 Tax=Mixta sp. BE291 TaxID=3158787 RepID=UPI0028635C1F|nr:hypothetical protein [Pantoea alhagi]